MSHDWQLVSHDWQLVSHDDSLCHMIDSLESYSNIWYRTALLTIVSYCIVYIGIVLHCLPKYRTALFTLVSYCIVYLSIVLRPTSTTQHLKNIKSGEFNPFTLVRVIDLNKHNIQIYLEYSVLDTHNSDIHSGHFILTNLFILVIPSRISTLDID